MTEGLDIWTVYDHPSDYPNSFVARKHTMTQGATSDLIIASTLEEVREMIQAVCPYVLSLIPRAEADDPVIVECWL